jgi:cell division FtsZ-interacting protein ZapD
VVAIRDPNSGEEAPPVRAFVSLTDDYDSKTKYFTMEVAIRDVDGRNQVLSDALKEAQSYKQKWSHLHEVSQIIDAIDRVTQSL